MRNRVWLAPLTMASLICWLGCSSQQRHPPSAGDIGADASAEDGGGSVVPVVDAAACAGKAVEVHVNTADGLVLEATWSDPCAMGAKRAIVLSHQLCSTKAEWSASDSDWVSALGTKGIATLALDLRGHGGSTHFPDGSMHDLCKETDANAAALMGEASKDVAAGIAWVKQQGATKVGVVGASIGGNASLVVLGADTTIHVAVALSPGADYFGIKPAAALMQAGSRPIALVAADDDPSSAADVRAFAQSDAALMTKIWPTGGHANAIIRAHPEELTRLAALVAGAL